VANNVLFGLVRRQLTIIPRNQEARGSGGQSIATPPLDRAYFDLNSAAYW
jgi:hypothetical protein